MTSLVCAAACSDGSASTSPLASAPSTLRADRHSESNPLTIRVKDDCDPETFDAVFGPGTCVKAGGGTKFDHFIAEVTQLHRAPAWSFEPGNVNLRVGDAFAAMNMGGEVHTFTEVAQFGGGIVAPLNDLAGTPNVAPECLDLQPGDFLAPGAAAHEVADEQGVEKYQCCIHPWMRAEVRVSAR